MYSRPDKRLCSAGMHDVTGIVIRHLRDPDPVNLAIHEQFSRSANSADVVCSHYFGARFENIYVELAEVPAVNTVLAAAKQYAGSLLQSDSERLKIGFWFNDMRPGDCTTLHCHDEFDELLSGVYYVRVPADSGNLVIWNDERRIEIEPEEGMFVFFSPRVMHEVSENNSSRNRLSLGLNIGGDVP